MTDLFLKAKHWQLFLLTFGIPLIIQIIITGMMTSDFITQGDPDPAVMVKYMRLIPLIFLVFFGVLFGWLYSVAVGLQKRVPEDIKMKVRKFKIFFFIPMVYILGFIVIFSIAMSGLITSNFEPDVPFLVSLFAFIIPMHLFSMFCIFYTLYFVAKTFKTVELQREVRFSDFVGEFFMIWFYPIGIWVVQPRINRVVSKD